VIECTDSSSLIGLDIDDSFLRPVVLLLLLPDSSARHLRTHQDGLLLLRNLLLDSFLLLDSILLLDSVLLLDSILLLGSVLLLGQFQARLDGDRESAANAEEIEDEASFLVRTGR
jgi:hypothetical protein